MALYTTQHARAGLTERLPRLECFPNQYPRYAITIESLEFTSVCPRTELPDFGHLTIRYMPKRWCLELRALKLYLNAYRNLGIFQENAVNRVLRDVVAACRPAWAAVTGRFHARGGLATVIEARYPLAPASRESWPAWAPPANGRTPAPAGLGER